MNIALVLQHKVLLAFQGLFNKLPQLGSPQRPSAICGNRGRTHVPASHSAGPAPVRSFAKALQAGSARPAAKVVPLRVLRVVERDMPRSSTGRLVISGRMADVCAELDRLVEREAALQ